MKKGYKSLKEIEEKTNEIGERKPSPRKGKTYQEMYGKKKAKELKEKLRKGMLRALRKNPSLIKTRARYGKDNGMYGSARFGKKNPMFGRKHSRKTRDEIGRKAMGRRASKKTKAELSGIVRERYKDIDERMKSSQPGELNGNWHGGISREPYGFDFNRELKEIIRKRDNYACKICKKVWIVDKMPFPVHHIDYDKKNNNSDNLITLCGRCHGRTNSNRKYWVKYLKNLL